MTSQKPVKVFISYSHDSQEHADRVLKLSNRLRADGIDCLIDQYEFSPPEGWAPWRERQIREADFILMICTETYYLRAMEQEKPGTGRGVKWESYLIYQHIYDADTKKTKFIPVLFEDGKDDHIPAPVKGGTFYRLYNGYENLYRHLTNQPLSLKPDLGPTRQLPPLERKTDFFLLSVTRPGLARHLFDRWFPGLHSYLTRLGTLPEPPELHDMRAYLAQLSAKIHNDLKDKTYLSLRAKNMYSSPLPIPHIHQVIRQLVEIDQGGDSASAQIAAVNRRSRPVCNIKKAVLRTRDPLILLGDPGTGKTMTLQQAALKLAGDNERRVFPIITIYVRLGEFYCDGPVGPDDVFDYVFRSVPPEVGNRLDALHDARRLVIFFDGMDEMSRERYAQHTEALSKFAKAKQEGGTRTLFSCRITDFSPNFLHRRLVLLPFNRSQIAEYLRRYITFPLKIEDIDWKLPRLKRRLAQGELPIEPSNPFVLSLLCIYLQELGKWPAHRVDLLHYYNEFNYERKAEESPFEFPERDATFRAWAHLAYRITECNLGSAIPIKLLNEMPQNSVSTAEMLKVGERCGILVQSRDSVEPLVRFEHHRFQEFFAALHINEAHPSIHWLDKLDAPRWQETMLNVVLLGENKEVVNEFTQSIEQPIQDFENEFHRVQKENKRRAQERERHKEQSSGQPQDDQAQEEKTLLQEEASSSLKTEAPLEEPEKEISDLAELDLPKLPNDVEMQLSDRVELGSRMIRQTGGNVVKVQESLAPVVHRGVSFLIDHGNPITQVKMLRACQNVPQLDVINALAMPLKSPIRWVRNQALIVMAGSRMTGQIGGSDLATEVGYDLANGLLLSRIRVYAKAIIGSGKVTNLWFLLLGALCHVLIYLASALIGVGSYVTLIAVMQGKLSLRIHKLLNPLIIENYDFVNWTTEPYVPTVLAILILVVFIVSWKEDSGSAWIPLAIGPTVGIAVLAVGFFAWKGNLIIAIRAFFIGAMQLITLGTIFTLVVALWHMVVMFVYLLGTVPVRTPAHRWRSFFSSAWNGGSYIYSLTGLVLFISYTIYYVIYYFIDLLGFGWFLWGISMIFWILVIGRPLLYAIVWVLSQLKKDIRNALYLVLFITVIVAGYWILDVTGALDWIKSKSGVSIGRTVGILLFTVVFAFSLSIARKLIYELWSAVFLCRQMFPPNRFTPDEWKDRIRAGDPDKQRNDLVRTNHQSLGLNPEQYMSVLQDIEEAIKKEPALSTYWNQRDQLQEVLKQERG